MYFIADKPCPQLQTSLIKTSSAGAKKNLDSGIEIPTLKLFCRF